MARLVTFSGTALVTWGLSMLVPGCASPGPAAAPVSAVATTPAPRPSPNVYFYPTRGQSTDQQDRDRYDCYLWARRQTGYDPSVPRRDGGPPVQVLAMPPPGHDTLTGAAAGAIIGAAVSDPWHSGEGTAIGAVAGAVIGAAADASRQQTAQRIQEHTDAERNRAIAQSDAVVLDYRHAIQACLGARGYTVQ